jgi:hypothetical protein
MDKQIQILQLETEISRLGRRLQDRSLSPIQEMKLRQKFWRAKKALKALK